MSRILTPGFVVAMVALDTVEPLAERIKQLLAHGRRMAMSQRYTWTQEPPKLYTGLTVKGTPELWRRRDDAGFSVRLEPGPLMGFGFATHRHLGAATEQGEWARYHAAEGESPDFFKRRRNMTCVTITGGGECALRDDSIVIQEWNDDGVCDERVIAFEAPTRERS